MREREKENDQELCHCDGISLERSSLGQFCPVTLLHGLNVLFTDVSAGLQLNRRVRGPSLEYCMGAWEPSLAKCIVSGLFIAMTILL